MKVPGNNVYFLVKSKTMKNLHISFLNDAWATTKQNTFKLVEKFLSDKTVVILFSCLENNLIFGFGVMESLPLPSYKPDIFSNPPKNIAHNFKVRWIKNRLTSYNSYSEKKIDLNCSNYRDGEELNEEIGINFVKLLEDDKDENLSEKDTVSIDSNFGTGNANEKEREKVDEIKKSKNHRTLKHKKKFDYWEEYNQMKIQNL